MSSGRIERAPAGGLDDGQVTPFKNRSDAGKALALHLGAYADRPDVQVFGLPRGGVPVAYEVAQALSAPLDVFVVRKLGIPQREEYAMGAIAGDVGVLNQRIIQLMGVTESQLQAVIRAEQRELFRQERLYRSEQPPVDVRHCTAMLIDDGLATGSTMLAAIQAMRAKAPQRIVVAVPVGSADSCAALKDEVDALVCLATPEPFESVGRWYLDFVQITDEEVQQLLGGARS